MNCAEIAALLDSSVDGELDAARRRPFQEHLRSCPCCAARHGERQALRALVRRPPKHRASDRLRRRVAASIRVSAPEPPARAGWWRWHLGSTRWATGLAVTVAAGLLLVVALRGGQDTLPRDLVSSHVRSRLAGHLTDVASADGHTVKPWLGAKLDFSPPVPDLASAGFPLVGGRLDYVADRTVAALVYERRQHVINLFVWPAPEETEGGAGMLSRDGFNICYWRRAGLTFWAVSDLSTAELDEFEHLFKAEMKASARS
jgi:anti-sigma factor RsiW